jgi:hypothetical protein
MRFPFVLCCAVALAGCLSSHGRCYGRAERDPETGLCECPPGTTGADCREDASIDEVDGDDFEEADGGSPHDATSAVDAVTSRDGGASDAALDARAADASIDANSVDAASDAQSPVADAQMDTGSTTLDATTAQDGSADADATQVVADASSDGSVGSDSSVGSDPIRGSIGAGEGFACALRASGQPVCWGSGLGRAGGAPAVSFSTLSVGTNHACGVRTDGFIQCWGGNLSGQSSPPQTGGFRQVAAGHDHTCGLKTDGAVVCWGGNASGQASAPSRLFAGLAAGHSFTCGVGSDGLVSCWGWGDGRTDAPTTVAYDSITLGGIGGCGIRSSDQFIQCWQGGTPTASLKPPTGAFFRVMYGTTYICGVRPSGSVECWGDDPVAAPGGTFKEVALSPTQYSACGISSTGNVSCWGPDAATLGAPPS